MDEINEKNILNYLCDKFHSYEQRYNKAPRYLNLTYKNYNDLRANYESHLAMVDGKLTDFWGAEIIICNKTGLSCRKRKGRRIKC